MGKTVYRATVEGNGRRGRPQRRWRDEVKVTDGERDSEKAGIELARYTEV